MKPELNPPSRQSSAHNTVPQSPQAQTHPLPPQIHKPATMAALHLLITQTTATSSIINSPITSNPYLQFQSTINQFKVNNHNTHNHRRRALGPAVVMSSTSAPIHAQP
jgi:hypothetical protein